MNSLSRRSLLRAAAGLPAALPWLESLGGFAHAQTGGPIRRLLLIFTPNGTLHDSWVPQGSSGRLTLSPLLQPLTPHLSRITVVDGLDMESAKHSPGVGHQAGIGTLWTGTELLHGTFGNGNGMSSGWAGGPSVDQVIAQALMPPTVLRSLELKVGWNTQSNHDRMIFSGADSPVSYENNPQAAFERLFGNGVLTNPTAFAALRARRRKVVDAVQAQLQSLKPRFSKLDRLKLDQHLSALSSLEASLSAPVNITACTPPAAPPPQTDALWHLTTQAFPAVSDLMIQLVTGAFACDLTRIASLQFDHCQGDNVFHELGHNVAHHELSHSLPSDTAGNDKLRQINLWYAQKVAELLNRLASISEGAGTLLDSTLVVWGNELGTGWSHSQDQIPFLLAGGLIPGGRFIQADGPHNRLLVSICHAMGLGSVNQVGNPAYGSGPLSGLL